MLLCPTFSGGLLPYQGGRNIDNMFTFNRPLARKYVSDMLTNNDSSRV